MGHIHAAWAEQAEDIFAAHREDQERQGAALLALLKDQMPSLPLALAEDRTPAFGRDAPPSLTETLLLPGRVTELCAEVGQGAFSLALTLARLALAHMPRRFLLTLPDAPLCAYALRQLSVPLSRLLLVHAPPEDRLRLCVRSLKSGVFAGVILDLRGFDLSRVLVGLRRVALAAEEHETSVIVLTEKSAPRPLPLPVAVRADVARHEALEQELCITVQRHMFGRYAPLSHVLPEHDLSPRYDEPVADSPAGKRRLRGRATHARGHRERTRAASQAGRQMALHDEARS